MTPDETPQTTLVPDSEELEQADRDELADPDPQPEPVTYTGTDFDVEGLVRRLQRGDIVIPTFGEASTSIETERFQRRFVWGRNQMSRFIESLLLGYPIPGIFLVQQADRRYLVLDGQQRMRTLADFYAGHHKGKPFVLEDVADDFSGLSYESLSPEQRRTLDNTFIPAIIVRTDGSADSLDAVYQVFERLNSGGTQLTPHEIRVALYAGPIMEFLAELNDCETWRSLYGPESRRLRDQELVLRIVALHVSPGTYRRPLKRYLNDFAAQHRFLEDLPVDRLREQFSGASEVIRNGPGPDALRYGSRQVNAALTEAIFVGMMRRLEAVSPPDPSRISAAIQSMHEQAGFDLAISRATADEEAVRTRLFVATQAFAGI
jgi:hypothetical protein